ncbi:hypothetical protein, conserved [Babesia bigemina]|uniref:Uncharacterized protein n=1 Tax=Babesia bigemina TaxID=5866 RepID=A0A061D4H0_BABBI|nr:hypothetical protein, conserved [Babesia bigemina]CDR95626.1 hypothetical protein, conserved [Babesia bigemina]|eukprot:XP_012767812.1 hypothetical protein, conserved [Babesia bigemina]
MYPDGEIGGASGSRGQSADGEAEPSSAEQQKHEPSRYAAVLYRNVPGAAPDISQSNDGDALRLPAWQAGSSSSSTSGALLPWQDIYEPYGKFLNGTNYNACTPPLQSLPSGNVLTFAPSGSAASDGSQQSGSSGTQNANGISNVGVNPVNRVGDVTDAYGLFPPRLDRAVTVSELMKLTDAVNELTKRMPLPPTQELLSAIEPQLAMTLQLTYLKAYIQNQQLLIDIKNGILGGILNGCDFRNSMRLAVPTLDPPPPMEQQQFNTPYYGCSDGQGMAVDGMCDVAWAQPPAIEYPMGEGSPPSNPAPFPADGGDFNSSGTPQFPPFTEVFEALQQTQFLPPMIEAPPPPSGELLASTVLRTAQPTATASSATLAPESAPTPGATAGDGYETGGMEVAPPKNEIPPIPAEIRNMVKYDGQKHAFVAVYLGPLGARRRRLFSIRKFGVEGALKLATDFAVGSTSAAVASKERRLLEEVCEVALRANPASGSCLDHVEEARAIPETRGIVFSCGAQLWMVITYDAVSGERSIEAFSVQSLGFQGAYQAAVAALDERLKNGAMTSKLSGPIYFWLEGTVGKAVLCLMVTPRDLMRQSTCEQELYIGRFDVTKSGGFNSARKLAQKWRSELRNVLTQC